MREGIDSVELPRSSVALIARRNSRGHLDRLARRYRGALVRFFVRRAPRLERESEDLAQEVFVRIAQRTGGEDIAHAEGYLFQTASSVLADRVRRGRVRRSDDHIPHDESIHAGEDFSPERVLIGKEKIELVVQALEQLPLRTQEVFVLQRFEEMTYAEIARRLGVSVSAVEKHMMRALRHLVVLSGDDE